MSLRELARHAKVSTATVSRVINRVPTVNRQMAKRVWRAVEELGYCPNSQARSLVCGRSYVLGVIVWELNDPFYSEIAYRFEEMSIQYGYEVLICSAVHDCKRPGLSARRMLERQVDGIAVLTFEHQDELIQALANSDLPLVCIGAGSSLPGVIPIQIDYLHGIRQAVQHLAALRHRRIALVAGPPHLRSTLAEKEAFERAMEEISLEVLPELVAWGDHTAEGGMRAFAGLLAARLEVTAVLCSNDMTAIGVIREARECSLKVPDDVSVVGFECTRISQYMSPALSTVSLSQTELANTAFAALMTKMKIFSGADHSALRTDFLPRNSTALARSRSVAGANRSCKNEQSPAAPEFS